MANIPNRLQNSSFFSILAILNLPYEEKIVGQNFRRAKFSSPNEKFVTSVSRKVSPNKSKSVVSVSV